MTPEIAVSSVVAAQPPAPLRNATPLTVELTSPAGVTSDDLASWQALVNQRPQVGIFLSPAWLQTFY
jgi:hypothetical protein